MAITRYAGDKFYGLESEKDILLTQVMDGATYYCSDSLIIYIKIGGFWTKTTGAYLSGVGTPGVLSKFVTSDTLANTTAPIFESGSNVGIGTTTPISKLTIGASGSTVAISGLTFGVDPEANLYRSAASTIKTDGNFYASGSGNFISGVYSNGSILATATNLASTGSTLTTSITSLSGTLTGGYATIANLASTGSTLNTKINTLSGYTNATFLVGQGDSGYLPRWSGGSIGNKTLTSGIIFDNGSQIGIKTDSPTSLLTVGPSNSTTAANGLSLGNDSGANLYRSATSTIKTDGNFYALGSGNFISGVYSNGSILATATNLASTGSTLTTSITSLSGTLTGGYATIANLASTGSTLATNLTSTGSTLNASIASLSGTLTSNYATITNLASTGSGLNVRVAALSGNLISTGSTLTTSISNLSGTLTSNYATITNLASTGSTLNAKRLSTLSSSSTSNGTGNTVSGEWARIATTSQAANGRGSAWITITSDGGTIAPVARTFYVSKGSWHPEGGAISLLHQTISHASLDSIRMTNDTGTSKSNIDILWGAVVAAVNIKITVINDDSMNLVVSGSMEGYGYQSMYSGVTGLTPSENVVTSLNLTNNVIFGAASNSLGANAFVFNSSGIVVTGNRLVGQNDTGVLASAANLTSTGSTLTTSITSLSGTLTGGYATIANLASTGSTLNAKVDTLSGYANTTFATITNLASTGSTLVTNLASTGSTLTTSITSLSGTLTGSYVRLNESRPTVTSSSVSIGTATSTALLTVGTGSSTVAASGLAFGNDSGANLYRSAASTIKTDGNFYASGSGNFINGVYSNGSILATATNLASTGSTLTTSITSLSGTLTGGYATIANLASTGSTLTTSITSLSGTLTGGYATIANLASTGSTLNAKVDTLSGYANTTFATITNLASTGSTLTTSITSLSGTLTGGYATIANLASTGSTLNAKVDTLSGYANTTFATITNLASTGSTLNAKRLSTLSSSSTSNGTGNTVSGEWARIATTSQAANGRGSAWITITSDGGTIAPVARTFYVSKGSWHPEGGAISLLHQTISHASLDSIRMTNDTGTSKSNIDILWGAVVAAVNIKITVINDDSMNLSTGGYGYQSMYSGVTGLTPSENVVTSLNLTNNVVFGAASNSLGANAFVFNSSGIVVTGNRLVGQNDTGVLASAANLTSTGSTLTTSITSLSGTLTGSYVRLNESRPTVTSSSVSIGTATSTALLTVGTGSSTVAASGLAFGNDSGANLYRSAASTIKTDANLIVAQNLTVTSHLSAATKSFLIDHPIKIGKKLQYGVLEGPEHSVYIRGKMFNSNFINFPDYWNYLVDLNSITVSITPIGNSQNLFVQEINCSGVIVAGEALEKMNYYYHVFGERKDVPKIQIEI